MTYRTSSGGLVVNVSDFDSDDPMSNPAEMNTFSFTVRCSLKRRNKLK